MPKYSPEQNIQLAMQIRRGAWLLDDVQPLLPIITSILDRQDILLASHDRGYAATTHSGGWGDELATENSNRYVTVIPITGVITTYDSCGTIGTMTYAESLMKAKNDPDNVGVVLSIDSGGGSIDAIPFMVQAIESYKQSGRPIIAHTSFCGSAAYWIAAQCDAIFVNDSIISKVGSIGAYCHLIDDTEAMKKEGLTLHEIYADQSSDKNKPYREALTGKYDLIKASLSHLVDSFHTAVKSGRPHLQADAPGVLSGAMFFPAEALAVGLIDGVQTLEESIENVFVRGAVKHI